MVKKQGIIDEKTLEMCFDRAYKRLLDSHYLVSLYKETFINSYRDYSDFCGKKDEIETLYYNEMVKAYRLCRFMEKQVITPAMLKRIISFVRW